MKRHPTIIAAVLLIAACSKLPTTLWWSDETAQSSQAEPPEEEISLLEYANARYGTFDCGLIALALEQKGARINEIFDEQGGGARFGSIEAHNEGLTFPSRLALLEGASDELAEEHRVLKRQMQALHLVSTTKKCESIERYYFGIESAREE